MPATDNAIADAVVAAPENEEFITDTLVPNSHWVVCAPPIDIIAKSTEHSAE
jgi:hypothetical protein